jgi:hypothetical protein
MSYRGVYTPAHVRFWKHVTPCPNTGCWFWLGAANELGYGHMLDDNLKAKRRATHISYRMHYGLDPSELGLFVLHKCDVPSCVNPAHLFLGTAKDNSQDMCAKGRHFHHEARGEAHAGSKLTDDIVRAIRASREPLAPLAERYGVTMALISAVRHRKIWRHVQ